MDAVRELLHINWIMVIMGVLVALVAFKFLSELFEWVVKKFGIETKAMREKREGKELLIETTKLAKTTADGLNSLKQRHTEDEETFRITLEGYIQESRKDRQALHDEMKQYSENRINDRQQSFEIQKDLTNSIKELAKGQIDRDEKISALTKLFVDKQISDYRWEIINLADKISNGKIVSKECFKHALATHAKYEDIIKEYGLVNGEVEISMEIINDAYKQLMSGL